MHDYPTRIQLRAERITRSFAGRLVLDEVSLQRAEPGLVGLLGPNGSGKTTLLRIIAQLTQPDSGTLEVAGRRVEHGDDAAARRLVGWVPHTPLAWRTETIEWNLRYAARLAGASRTDARSRADDAIERWDLHSARAELVATRSRGWQQRYALARADLFAPPILLLDEPTTGLDEAARELLETALATWRRDRITIVASHERAWLATRSDQLLDLAHTKDRA